MSQSTPHFLSDELEVSISMLKQHVNSSEIEPLLSVLESLKQSPQDEAQPEQLSETFNQLGIAHGAVLTYAPYVNAMLSDNFLPTHFFDVT